MLQKHTDPTTFLVAMLERGDPVRGFRGHLRHRWSARGQSERAQDFSDHITLVNCGESFPLLLSWLGIYLLLTGDSGGRFIGSFQPPFGFNDQPLIGFNSGLQLNKSQPLFEWISAVKCEAQARQRAASRRDRSYGPCRTTAIACLCHIPGAVGLCTASASGQG